MYSGVGGIRFGKFGAAVVLSLLGVGTAIAGPISISGRPPTSVVAGQPYSFQPSGSSTRGRSLSFSVSNKPAWASFSISTGKLWGTPQTTQTGVYSNIVISVSDGGKAARLAPFAINVTAPVASTTTSTTVANRTPTISGSPLTQVKADAAYLFKPTASDPDGNTLAFSISNCPGWATFNTTTGTLSGTPTSAQVGTYNNIVISVSDGRGGSAALPAFAVSVVQAAMGAASLSWVPPAQNADGSTLTDLAGYRVYYGTTAGGPYASSATIANPSVSTFLVENLTPGTYYFVVTARNTAGKESLFSGQVSKTIN